MIAGQQITATLRLSHPLARGAMGSIWVADHLALGIQVAVKFMSPEFAQSASFIERFRREAMAAAQIKNPHVAQVFDHGITAEGVPYIVMELLEGEDLGKRVRHAGPLALSAVASIISQAAGALHRAHQLGIVHRDIKADNLFLMNLDGESFVKVLDFGIAKQISDANLGLTSTGNMVGTPLYMSPEQLLSAKHVDARSDLWSLAVVAYFAMTGQLPFNGETLGALCVAVHGGVYAPPSSLLPGLPLAVDAWFQRALQRAPEARFASAREMAEELAGAVGAPAAFQPDTLNPPPLGFGVPEGNASASQGQSSPSHGVLGSSGTGSPTFAGTAHTGAGSPSRRIPPFHLAAAAVLGLVLGVGTLLFFRSQSEPTRVAADGATSVSPSGAATLASAPRLDPVTVPTSGATSDLMAPAVAPETPSASSPAASAPAIVAARPATSGRPLSATSITPPKPSSQKTATPLKPKDTIGF